MNINDISLGVVVQARTGSTRLPNKVMLDFYKGKSILDVILEKFSESYFKDLPKILATSSSVSDEALNEISARNGFDFFQGNEDDVLQRFIEVGERFGLTHMIRVCADNPFLNMNSVIRLADTLLGDAVNLPAIDYLSFVTGKNTPTIKSHLGLFAEIVSLNALQKAYKATNLPLYHEHVTNFIYTHEGRFNVKFIPAPAAVLNREDIRLTVDNREDFENLARLYGDTRLFLEDIEQLVCYLDTAADEKYKTIMINNIKKYTK